MRYPQLARRGRFGFLPGGVVAAALVALAAGGCDRVATTVGPEAAAVRAAKVKSTQTFFFTKVPATVTTQAIAPAVGVHLFDFDVKTTAGTKGYILTKVAFMVSGSLQA